MRIITQYSVDKLSPLQIKAQVTIGTHLEDGFGLGFHHLNDCLISNYDKDWDSARKSISEFFDNADDAKEWVKMEIKSIKVYYKAIKKIISVLPASEEIYL